MIKYLSFLFTLLFLISCAGEETKMKETDDSELNKTNENDSLTDSVPAKQDQIQTKDLGSYEASLKLENYLVSELSVKDFITIKENYALIISPDEAQIEKLKSETGEESFYVAADDNMWYQYEAEEYLKKKNIKLTHPEKRYVRFITKDQKEYYFDTRAIAGWTTVLFRPDSLPKIINPVGIEKESEMYFGK